MRRTYSIAALICMLAAAAVNAQSSATKTAADGFLATVRISRPVMAAGKPLPAGTYSIRLTADHPTPLAGQSPDAQEWVEFIVNGTVVAREIAEVLDDTDLTPVGASSFPVRSGTRVEVLRGGEFLRVSVKGERNRYLIHLPLMP